ncbi:glycoside hydrolase family 16 protein [Serendipita vermifera MAFF 305830]|uniref:Glycoside hydrolase family 16 protein n=1 Tax=Serendipita vermifera MAFF 305830 TaxID=933852 RepID=A0A0C2WEJ9_SERVB|nr:glycoside hydrolase family 16 protein [Serendipita vermifera MAFF 305830]
MASLSPPVTTTSRRASRFSTLSSANSTYSVFSDSKYPAPAREDGTLTPPPSGAFEPYEYDPSWDQDAPDDEEDALHAPDPPGTKERIGAFNFRGFFNIVVVFGILAGLIIVFAVYPIVLANYSPKSNFFSGTGQADPANDGDSTPSTSTSRTASDLIDPDTPESAKTWAGLDGTSYKLVFSDEFKKDDRTFKAGDDPFWEAVDLYDHKNQDLNYYDSGHVTTKDGSLVITMEEKSSHTRDYTSGMLQSWNKMCFTGGYIEVAVSLPGSSQTIGFTPQVYTMGNLARSGYGATEEGMLPYSYNTCDLSVGAGADGSSLPGQRLSACTCQTERTDGNHPGPAGTNGNPSRGRGAPQVDLLGNLNQQRRGGIVSQSLRVAPLSQGLNVPGGATVMSGDTELNAYAGDTTQQVISALTNADATAYTNGGAQFETFGYEHIVSGGVETAGSLHWVKGGATETFRVDATALATDGNIGQRLIPNEPMYVVLSLALSQLVDTVAPGTLTFPAKLLVDYVRVYQIEGQESVTCNPTGFPTKAYIEKFAEAYGNPTHLTWADAGYTAPLNSNAGNC